MADPNTRQGKRTPVTLKIKFKSETLEQFIERYAVDVSQGGIFIRTKEPLAVGTQMKFEFQLRDASPLIAGEGTVVWTRENDPSRPAIAPGMGVRFDRLAEGSPSVLEKILQEKAKLAPQRSHVESSKPPMFTDTPTRVAPAPVQEALLSPNKRPRSDSEQTPLPKPMPFHSDADEFPEEAFEEATKVRSLDDLVAATAAGGVGEDRTETKAAPPEDEARPARADSTLADPPAAEEPKPAEDEPDSAPGLPSPPEVSAAAATRPGKLLDTTPSPRPSAEPDEPERDEVEPPPAAPQMKTRLGVEAPAKRPTTPPAEVRRSEPAPASAREPAPKRPSTAPIWIGGLVVVAIGLAAVWYFFLRSDLQQRPADGTGSAEVASGSPETAGSAALAGSDVATTGSAGSDVAMAGSDGSAEAMAGSAETPTGPTENTVVAADIAKATVEVEGTDQRGTVPFTAKLEQGKSYKVRVSAPGYLAQELDVQGGKDKVVAKLAVKPHVLSVKSTPPGAAIYIDGSNTGKYTPFDVQLTASQAARPRVRVTLRKSGYASREQVITSSTFAEEDERLTAGVDATLSVSVPLHTGGSSVHSSSGTGSAGSASTPGSGEAGSASGSAATQPEGGATSPDTGATKPDTGVTKPDTGATKPDTGAGAGSAATKPSGGAAGSGGAAAAGSGDPTPSWAH